MSVLVVDASVIVKWMMPSRQEEEDVARAIEIFEALRQRRVTLVQPPHWLAEVAAVITRLSPGTARQDVDDLYDMELAVETGPDAYRVAVELARSLPHHLFDTLYHAVALTTPDALFVTADERYFMKARHLGAIVRLRDLDLG